LLKNGKHKVTAITRKDSKSKIPDGVAIKEVNYDDKSSLVAALQGQEALIITMAVTAPRDTQQKLFEAAAAANVPWILPNEFGYDGPSEQADQDMLVGAAKKLNRNYVEKLGKSSWLGIACGFWYEFSLSGGVDRYGFDLKNRSVTFCDEGTVSICTSTWPQTGRGVANLLALKVLPDDENDRSPCLANFRNKFVRIDSFTLNQKEMFESIMRVTGTNLDDWKITKVPVKEYFAEAKQEVEKGNMAMFARRMYSRMFFPDNAGGLS
jgi:hypothetical protein